MVKTTLIFLFGLLLLSCDIFEELDVTLYVEDSYTGLGDDYVTIRYDYTAGYNTIAKLDLYEFDSGSSINEYIKTYPLSPGMNRELALEDADYRIRTSGGLRGYRLEVIPMQARSGEQSPFNFFSGESYYFRIDQRDNAGILGPVEIDETIYSDFFFGGFQGANWIEQHSRVYIRPYAQADGEYFNTLDYRYRFGAAADLTDPLAADDFIPIPNDAGSVYLAVVNAVGGFFATVSGISYDFAPAGANFNYTPGAPTEVNLLSADTYGGFSWPSGAIHPEQYYRIEVIGAESNGIGETTIPYYIYNGVRYLPSFTSRKDGPEQIITMEFTLEEIVPNNGIAIYLSNPNPQAISTASDMPFPGSNPFLTDPSVEF
jgi:hypothetical protein